MKTIEQFWGNWICRTFHAFPIALLSCYAMIVKRLCAERPGPKQTRYQDSFVIKKGTVGRIRKQIQTNVCTSALKRALGGNRVPRHDKVMIRL